MKPKINYISAEKNKNYFFSPELQNAGTRLNDALNGRGEIAFFPDATIKSNGSPNGIAITSTYEDTILLPYILRDPGCGFLMFQVKTEETIDSNWSHKIGGGLDSLLNEEIRSTTVKEKFLNGLTIENIMTHGLNAIDNKLEDPSRHLYTNFFPDETKITLTEQEINYCYQDLMGLTNTVELRQIQSLAENNLTEFKNNDVIGFIHLGCNVLPSILSKRFVFDVAKFAHINNHFTLNEIKQGDYGVPLCSALGWEYYQWIKASMNFALVSRYFMYLAIKEYLLQNFNCQVSLINDVTHAGVFSIEKNNKTQILTSRGIQPMPHHEKFSFKNNLRLVAGEKESVALLVTAANSENQLDNLIQHGTGYQQPNEEMLSDYFQADEVEMLTSAASHAYYNTDYDIKNCLPFSYNTLVTQDHQKNLGLIKPLALLTPLVNLNGKHLHIT